MTESDKSKRILIVDDEKALAKALSMKLSSVGYSVETLYDGTEVLDKLTSEKFNLVLLDMVMPNVNGFEVLENMKSKKIDVPVIALSNLSQDIDKVKAEKLGVRDYFIKSNTPIKEVVEQVKKFI